MAGWIKLHRRIVDSDIYQMPPLYLRVFERLALEVNHQDNEIPYKEKGSKVVGKKLIKRGEKLTSVRDICKWVSWYERGKLKEPNPKTIQSILDWLEENHMIEIYGDKGNRKETHYKIVNYNTYQDKDEEEVTEKKQPSNSEVTVDGEVSIQSLDTNKNVKNVKEDSLCMYDENFKEISNLYTDNIGPILPVIGEQLKNISGDVPAELFREAVKIAVDKKKRYINYIEGILKNWKDDNILTLTDLEAHRKEKEVEKIDKQQEYQKKKLPYIKSAAKTRFHNFDQRSDKYSNDQLEDIAARKRREYAERNKPTEAL